MASTKIARQRVAENKMAILQQLANGVSAWRVAEYYGTRAGTLLRYLEADSK